MSWFLYDNGLRHERVNKYDHHCTAANFIFSIFVSMFRRRPIYVLSV